MYYGKRICWSNSKDFISGIFQIRIFKNLTAGFSYDYSTNRLNSTPANSLEVTIGPTPMMAIYEWPTPYCYVRILILILLYCIE